MRNVIYDIPNQHNVTQRRTAVISVGHTRTWRERRRLAAAQAGITPAADTDSPVTIAKVASADLLDLLCTEAACGKEPRTWPISVARSYPVPPPGRPTVRRSTRTARWLPRLGRPGPGRPARLSPP